MPAQGYGAQQNLANLPFFHNATLIGGADVVVTGNATYNDLITLGSLPIGQYLVGGYLLFTQATNASTLDIKVWDGTTSYGAAEFTLLATDDKTLVIPSFILTLAAAATIKVSAASSNATTTTARFTPTTSATGLTGLGCRLWAYHFA